MSKERRFHELIEQQNREEKDRVWAKIRPKEEKIPIVSKVQLFWRKWVPIMASSLAVIAFGVFALVNFFPSNINGTNSSSSSENANRYFTNQSYEIKEAQITLKDYAQEIGKNLLYFDWYTETDYFENELWQLKDNGDIICFAEEIIDINTGCAISIFVIEANTELEAFSSDENTDRKSEIKGVQIDWRMSEKAFANFVYEDYKYYLRVKEPIDENYILSLLEELLS